MGKQYISIMSYLFILPPEFRTEIQFYLKKLITFLTLQRIIWEIFANLIWLSIFLFGIFFFLHAEKAVADKCYNVKGFSNFR